MVLSIPSADILQYNSEGHEVLPVIVDIAAYKAAKYLL
jgi:hypothetical protein